MGKLHRDIKRAELHQSWRRDPGMVLARYREVVAGVAPESPSGTPLLREMIEAIIEHESAELTSTRVLRSIAA